MPANRKVAEDRLKDIKLVVVDPESGASKVCGFDDTWHWDWSNRELVIMVDGWEITNLDQLTNILLYKVSKGRQEVKVYETPRAMLLGGG